MNKIVCHGDSLTEASDLDKNYTWPILVQNSLNIKVVISGIGGDTSGVLATLGINSFFTGFSAADLDVNAALVADEALIATGRSVTAGDNTNVLELAALRTAEIFDGGTRPLEDFYQGVVSRLATEAAKSYTRASTRDSLLLRLENEREQVSGVSLDEELTKLIQFQRTYQGAARFVSENSSSTRRRPASPKRRDTAGSSNNAVIAVARASLSPMGTTSPIPVCSTACRTPGRLLAMDGVPHSIASTCTNPNDSVELRLGTTMTSRLG